MLLESAVFTIGTFETIDHPSPTLHSMERIRNTDQSAASQSGKTSTICTTISMNRQGYASGANHSVQDIGTIRMPIPRIGGGPPPPLRQGPSPGWMPAAGQRRPALPRTLSAVPSARGGLTSGFGMGPGVPPLPWPPASAGHPLCGSRALRAAQRSDGMRTYMRFLMRCMLGCMHDAKSSAD